MNQEYIITGREDLH
jgi:hypothetical protein